MNAKFVAVDPKTGCHLREATQDEIFTYLESNPPRPFDKAVLVDNVLVYPYTGPGGSHTPGRFL